VDDHIDAAAIQRLRPIAESQVGDGATSGHSLLVAGIRQDGAGASLSTVRRYRITTSRSHGPLLLRTRLRRSQPVLATTP
jgi:hypothetical protein